MTDKQNVKQAIYNIFLFPANWIGRLEIGLVNILFSLVSVVLRIGGVNLNSSQLKTQANLALNKIINFLIANIISPLTFGLLSVPAKLINLTRFKTTPNKLGVNLVASLIFSGFVIDWLFENLICSSIASCVNLSFDLFQKIGIKKMFNISFGLSQEQQDQQQFKIEIDKIFNQYTTILKNYPNAQIAQKFAIFISTTLKNKFTTFAGLQITKRHLFEFKIRVLDQESDNNQTANQLRQLFDNEAKYEKLYRWANIVVRTLHSIRLDAETPELSLRFFEHSLGFILDELEKQTQIFEVDDNDQEILNSNQINLQIAKQNLNQFFNTQAEYWTNQNKPTYNHQAFNIFRDIGYDPNNYSSYLTRDLKRNQLFLINEEYAEDDLKQWMADMRNHISCRGPFLDSTGLIQYSLGKMIQVHDPEDEGNPESLSITQTALMTPIALMIITHYVTDHIRDRDVNRCDIIGACRNNTYMDKNFFHDQKTGTSRTIKRQLELTTQNVMQSTNEKFSSWWSKSSNIIPNNPSTGSVDTEITNSEDTSVSTSLIKKPAVILAGFTTISAAAIGYFVPGFLPLASVITIGSGLGYIYSNSKSEEQQISNSSVITSMDPSIGTIVENTLHQENLRERRRNSSPTLDLD